MSAQSETTKFPSEGDTVNAKVVKLKASGIVVQLEGDHRGFIRNRELYWKRSLGEPERTVSIGDEIQAVVLETDLESGRIELSRKRALGDPWEKVERGEYHVGQVVSGEIVNIEGYGAFVELEPGIVGLLHKSAIPGGRDKEIQELLWIGDQVEVEIIKIDPQKQRLGLSIVECSRKRHDEKIKDKRFGRTRARGHDDQARDKSARLPRLSAQILGRRVRRVLIVDDDVDFAVGFAEWLGRLGCEVTTIETGQEAISSDLACDVVFLDIDLPDIDGISVAYNISKRDPNREIILVTGLTWLDQNTEVPEGLEVTAALLKPLDYGEVWNILSSIEHGTLTRVSPKSSPMHSRDVEFLESISASLRTCQNLREALESILNSLRQETGAEAVLVFEVDPFTLETSIAAASGFDIASMSEKDLLSLRHSVVKAVALDDEAILEGTAARSRNLERLFDILYFYLRFESCLAVPVPATEYDTRHALFLFHPRPDQFTRIHFGLAFSVSYLITAAIQEEAVRTLITESQRSILTGQLASSLMHELRNKINRIEQQARNLELDCQDLADTSTTLSPHLLSIQMGKRVKRILNANAGLRGLTLEYLGLMGKDEFTSVSINELVRKTMRQMIPSALKHGVKLGLRLDPRMPRTEAISLRLEQVLLNVSLNAIQQMGAQVHRGGMLQVATLYDSRDKNYPIKIRFIDEGPGVHCKHRDWIFEMGTSTREEGTGLGLFVSKGLLESMGGRITLEKSYMFVGSTFLIELPVVPGKGE